MEKNYIGCVNIMKGDEPYEGEWIHEMVDRVMETGEGIVDGAPKIYTERSKGVLPEHNIRNDKWDQALMAAEAVNIARVNRNLENMPNYKKTAEGGDIHPEN